MAVRRPALVALASGLAVIASGLTVPLSAGPAQAAERTATIVGSLQDELGCSADWQPDCEASQLVRDGDSTAYRKVFDVPKGSYELKVAINGSWDENYGRFGAFDGANHEVHHRGGPLVIRYDHRTRDIVTE